MKIAWNLLLLILLCVGSYGQQQRVNEQGSTTFTNPLLPTGPDPWVEYRDGVYYYMNTTGTNLTLWRTRSMADLKSAEKKVAWIPPSTGPYSHDIWAPEIHFLAGKWYIYFAADALRNHSHRNWVVENPSADPFQGEWTLKGKVSDASDKWAIDPSVFEDRGQLYAIWSGWDDDENGTQSIYIARMKNPWTVEGPCARLSTPEYPWEKVGDVDRKIQPGDPPHIDVNESPEILKHEDKIFLVYSGSACWTDYYALGMLEATVGKRSDESCVVEEIFEACLPAIGGGGSLCAGPQLIFQISRREGRLADLPREFFARPGLWCASFAANTAFRVERGRNSKFRCSGGGWR